MANYSVLIKSNAVAGREADFEQWYNSIHLGEVLALPGFLSGRQFRYPENSGGAFSHFALFEVESDDIEATLTDLGEAFASGKMTMTDALDVNTVPETIVCQATGTLQKQAA